MTFHDSVHEQAAGTPIMGTARFANAWAGFLLFAALFFGFALLMGLVEKGATEAWSRMPGRIAGPERSFLEKWVFIGQGVRVDVGTPGKPVLILAPYALTVGRDSGEPVIVLVPPPGIREAPKIDAWWDRGLGQSLALIPGLLLLTASIVSFAGERSRRRILAILNERGVYVTAVIREFKKSTHIPVGRGITFRDIGGARQAVAEWTDDAGTVHVYVSPKFGMEPDPSYVGRSVRILIDPSNPAAHHFDITPLLQEMNDARLREKASGL